MKNVLIVSFILVLGFTLFFKLFFVQPFSSPLPRSNPVIFASVQPASTTFPQVSTINNLGLHVPQNFRIGIFAKNLHNPRDLEFTQGGTLLVSIPSQGKIVALPDENKDGAADKQVEVLSQLNKPHGIAFFQSKLYVAELTRVVRYSWNETTLTATQEKVLLNLPYNGGHNTRSLVFNSKGQLFISLGSSCNVCVEKDRWLASVIVTDTEGNNPRVFATGLRNSVFLTINPKTDELWAADMGRDNLGDDLPPDEINIIKDVKDYGWPICFGKQIHDANFDKNVYFRDPCLNTGVPLFEIPAHSAPLGLTFINSAQFPSSWQGDLFVSYHGSWNRSTPTGYKVVHLTYKNNQITSSEDFLTGFLAATAANGPESALGRPVDLIFDKPGSLYLSDDKAGKLYKIIHGS